MTHKSKWLLFAPAGLVLVGAGASMIPWAGGLKEKRRPAKEWVAAGTLALAVFNAGLSLFGRGVAENVLYQLREKPQTKAGLPAGDALGTKSVGLG
jgi:formate hydrogenlyase subunit 3/multisubunit Na+/H+ antiporter MnhD subunit